MTIAKTTRPAVYRALVLAFCLWILPAAVWAQTTTDKPKAKPAPAAPAKPAPTPPAANRPVQQPPARPVQQAPVQQPNARPIQQAPVQQPNNGPIRQVPNGPGSNVNNGSAGRGGITGNGGTGTRGGITGNGGGTAPSGGGITGNARSGGGITGNGGNPAPGGGITGNGGNPRGGGITGGGITGGGPRPAVGGPVYHPPVGVATRSLSGGGESHFNARTSTTVNTAPGGHIVSVERPGLRATGFREDGRAAHIEHAREDGSKLVVDRGWHGDRRVEVVRPGGVRVVSAGRQVFVERPYRPGYVSRTYIVDGRTDVRVYRSYTYASVHYVTYVPAVYYQPAFYGWVGRPWGPGVAYGWGWEPAAPWFYGGYFAPAPVYDSPALWLTDFLLAANLRAAYDNQNQRQQFQDPQQQPPPDVVQGTGVTLTPEIKLQIAEEVRQQILAEQAAGTTPAPVVSPQGTGADVPPPALKQRVFVVSTNLDVAATAGGQACSLTAGDIIERTPGQSVTPDGKVAVNVMSSKDGDCPADFSTQVDLAILQDMQNQFREQVAAGMSSLASNQGKSGLPSGPAAGARRNIESQAPSNANSDAEAKDLVAKLNQEADQTETQIRQAANGGQ